MGKQIYSNKFVLTETYKAVSSQIFLRASSLVLRKMSQATYKQGMLAWDWPTNYVIIYLYGSSGGAHAFLLKIRLCQVLALQ